jgi:hypothetical protein
MRPADSLLQPRTVVIWGLALVAALWLAATAIAGVTQMNAPAIALSILPKSGFAYEARAATHALAGDGSIQSMRVSDGDLADALAALRREPFATTALTLIGVSRDQHGDHADAAGIVAAAHGLDKRQLIANAWLIHYYGTTGRNRDVLELLDEALKVRPQLTAQYMPAFAQALQNPETIPVFQTMLRANPDWTQTFWESVAANPASLPNAEILRSRILSGPEDLGDPDTLLMNAFIRTGRVDLAVSFGKNLPALPDDSDGMVRNASFSKTPDLPPLDWELINDGRIGAAIDERGGTLEINALPGAGGTVARQLLALAPGSYSLLIKLGRAEVARGSEITARLQCAESGAAAGDVLSAKVGADVDQPFVIADNACRFYWLNLDFSAIDSSEPALGSIAEVRIARGRIETSE